MPNQTKVPLWFSTPLLAVLFFHMMCESMVIPILAPTLAEPTSPYCDMLAGFSEQMHKLSYGIALAVYPVLVFIFAPIIGAISDNIGRRPILIIALIGTIIGCLAQGVAMEIMSLWIFIIGRALVGATAGVDGVIQAALLDKCNTQTQKDYYLGASLFAMSIGFMAGPAFAALLINEKATTFAWSLPFLSLVPIFALTLLALWKKIDAKKDSEKTNLKNVNWLSGITDIAILFKIKPARKMLWIFVLAEIGAGCFTALIPLKLGESFDFSVKEIAYFISLHGVFSSVVFGLIGPQMLKRFSKNFILRFSMFMCIIACAMPYFDELENLIWLDTFAMAMGYALSYYILLSIMADSASEKKRGWLLSVLSSLWGLTMGIGLVLCGIIVGISNDFGILICTILSLSAFLFSLERIKHFKLKDDI
ncbi:MAG: MFS transporter [Opitutales bacterium]|nr:MFS transporter [Opitutales bacterium]